MSDEYELVVQRLLSFTIKTTIGYIPLFGPILASAYNDIEISNEIKKQSELTNKIISKLKEDKNNLIQVSSNLEATIKKIGSNILSLSQIYEKYFIENSTSLNTVDKILLFARVLERDITQKELNEENKVDCYNVIYDFVCECESEVWVENDFRSYMYKVISDYFFYRFKVSDIELALFFSIKAIHEADSIVFKKAVFLETFIQEWHVKYISMLNKMTDSALQEKLVDKIWKSISSTIYTIENSNIDEFKIEENYSILSISSFENMVKSKNWQIAQLLSIAIAVLKDSSNHQQKREVINQASKFYEVYYAHIVQYPSFPHSTLTENVRSYYDYFFSKTP